MNAKAGSSWFEDTNEKVAELVMEAEGYRADASSATSPTDTPVQLHEQLLKIRASCDRVEEILVRLTRLRNKTSRAVVVAQDSLDEAWGTRATKQQAFTQQNAAPRERYAHYSLATIDLQRSLRKAQSLDGDVGSAVEQVRLMHKGLDATRWDIDLRVRLMTFDTRLER